MWARLVSTALGLWLMAAPAVLGAGPPVSTVDWIVGPIVASAAWVSLWEITRSLRWVNLPLGLWLATAPFVLGYPLIPLLNSLVVGLALAALSFVRGKTTQRLGGGWASLGPGRGPETHPAGPADA